MRVKLRAATEAEHGLVVDSFIRHQASQSGLPLRAVEGGARQLISRVLTNPSTEVRVAVDAEAPAVILGLVVVDQVKRVLWWVYVKKPAQGFGIARALLANLASPLRAPWLSRGARVVGRCVELTFDPLAILEA